MALQLHDPDPISHTLKHCITLREAFPTPVSMQRSTQTPTNRLSHRKVICSRPSTTQRIILKGEEAVEIGGKRFYHPNLEKVINEVAKSPYQSSKRQSHKCPAIPGRHLTSKIPPKVLQRFLEAATYGVYKSRIKYREHIPKSPSRSCRTNIDDFY